MFHWPEVVQLYALSISFDHDVAERNFARRRARATNGRMHLRHVTTQWHAHTPYPGHVGAASGHVGAATLGRVRPAERLSLLYPSVHAKRAPV